MAQDSKYGDFNIIHPDGYAGSGYPHDTWARMRESTA